MSDDRAQLLLDYYGNDFTLQEIADNHGVHPATVLRRIRQTMAVARERLDTRDMLA